jgi:aminoglycoside phosphotransferase (APT) family kinase protein
VEPAHQVDRWIDHVRDHDSESSPSLQLAAWWLRENTPEPPDTPTIVHGDFRPANVLVVDGRVGVVLDWELAHVGDPAEDVGWYTTSLYEHEHFVPGRWDEAAFLAQYEDRTRRSVDPHRLRFWKVLAAFKLTALALAATEAFRTGASTKAAGRTERYLRGLMAELSS